MDLQKIIGWLTWVLLCVAISVLAVGLYRVQPPSAKECLELAAGFVGLIFFFLLLGRSSVSAYLGSDDRYTNPEMYWYNIRLLAYTAVFFVLWAAYRAIVTGQFSN
jgi:hypothetical protein